MYRNALIALLLISMFSTRYRAQVIPSSPRSETAVAGVVKELREDFTLRKLEWGSKIFIRIFKEEKELEVWVKSGKSYLLYKTYPICFFSGKPGPKLKEGDGQAPEGFYYTRPEMLNPNSDYHLSIDVGYPNAFDRSLGRTGSDIKIHGDCVSIGCYAMTDPVIDRIWAIVCGAFAGGQKEIGIHCFPFRMTEQNMEKNKNSEWFAFWKNLQQGYLLFEQTRKIPRVSQHGGMYVFK